MASPTQREEFLNRFPEIHEFTDCAGQRRKFAISIRVMDDYGFQFRAREVVSSPYGYEFEAFSESSPQIAFSDLADKIRSALARRYLDPSSLTPDLLSSDAAGRVASGGVVIDGRFISWAEFTNLLQTHEGWEFHLALSS